jgi:hypothetical protein
MAGFGVLITFVLFIYIVSRDRAQLVGLGIPLRFIAKPSYSRHCSKPNVGANSIRHMGQLYYNRLTNNRIKSITLGTIMIIAFGLFILVINTVDKESLSIYHGLGFGFLLMSLTYILGLITFGQVIEAMDNKTFITYYKLGRLKFKEQTWGKTDRISLDQDQERRYYCLTITTASGQTLHVEKYPTLNEADERLNEFKKLFD